MERNRKRLSESTLTLGEDGNGRSVGRVAFALFSVAEFIDHSIDVAERGQPGDVHVGLFCGGEGKGCRSIAGGRRTVTVGLTVEEH